MYSLSEARTSAAAIASEFPMNSSVEVGVISYLMNGGLYKNARLAVKHGQMINLRLRPWCEIDRQNI